MMRVKAPIAVHLRTYEKRMKPAVDTRRPDKKSTGGTRMTQRDSNSPKPSYIALPRALALLAARLGATSEEIAGWVWDGPKLGGLRAYVNANELDPPPRFYYSESMNVDYLADLMACWFDASEIASFTPRERYICGKALIERWSKHPGIHGKGLVLARLRESRLLDIHPIYGGTQGTFAEEDNFPPLETGLFPLSLVRAIDDEDFEAQGDTAKANPVGHLNHDPDLQAKANEIAKRLIAERKYRRPTRDEVAKLLAAERGMDFATVLRRIRKQW